MKTKIALFVLIVMGFVLGGCAGTPSGSSDSAPPSLDGLTPGEYSPAVTIYKENPLIPHYNEKDGSLTMFTTKSIAFKIMPMTRTRSSRGPLDRTPDEFSAVIKQYEAQLAANPQDYDACIMLASLYIDRGNPGDADLAVKYSDQALGIRKGDSDALYARGLAYSEKTDKSSWDKALSDLEQVLRSNLSSMKGVLYVMGMLYYKEDRIDEAIASFEKVKTIDPEFVDIDEILEVLYKRKK